EFAAGLALNTVRLMAGSDWAPAEVQFAHHAPRDTSEHARVFASPVSFGRSVNAFVVEREFAERRVPAADARLYPILLRYLDSIAQDLPDHDDLGSSVRKVVGDAMRDGEPSLTHVAATLAMAPRTIQRRLREQGTDFKALVADTRQYRAIRYLKDPRHTSTEIAYLLGYSEVSAFNRAFKRWTGSTPSAYRRRAGVKGPGPRG